MPRIEKPDSSKLKICFTPLTLWRSIIDSRVAKCFLMFFGFIASCLALSEVIRSFKVTILCLSRNVFRHFLPGFSSRNPSCFRRGNRNVDIRTFASSQTHLRSYGAPLILNCNTALHIKFYSIVVSCCFRPLTCSDSISDISKSLCLTTRAIDAIETVYFALSSL